MISTHDFLGIREEAGPLQWTLPVRAKHTGGRQSLFGGVGLAAGILAMEYATGLPTYWATAQYISTTEQPLDLSLEVTRPAQGRSITQAQVQGREGENLVISIMGALGNRTELFFKCWDSMPDAGAPGQGVPVVHQTGEERLHDHMELRMARGMFGFTGDGKATEDERSLVWVRMPGVHLDRAGLSILADYMPSCVGNALGRRVRCSSLDNTIRFAQTDTSEGDEWVLLENRADYIGNGIAHGHCLMWSESGRLLASASQTMSVSVMDGS